MRLYGLIAMLLFCCSVSADGFSQKWELSKNQDGIQIYKAKNVNSTLELIKVECTLEGTYDKLISILANVEKHKDWVYNNKRSYLLKKYSPNDFIYYSETHFPWPMSNRDAVIHLTIAKDSLNRFLKISGTGLPNYIPEKDDKVRVKRTSISWHVTQPSANHIKITYVLDADPGGSLPSWLINMFADDGPLESFKKLAALLKQ